MVEHDLAKVGVEGPSPFSRSRKTTCKGGFLFFIVTKKIHFFQPSPLYNYKFYFYIWATLAGIAQLVEHDLAKVGVEGPSPFSRSRKTTCKGGFLFFIVTKKIHFFQPSPLYNYKFYFYIWATLAGIAQLVEHDLAKVGVEGPSPFSRSRKTTCKGGFLFLS